MGQTDTKRLLWANVSALMKLRYGKEKLGQFARDCKIGSASMTRIKVQETSVGVDVIENIADAFKLQPWQLLAPDLGAALYVINEERRVVPVYSSPAPPAETTPAPAPKASPGARVGKLTAVVIGKRKRAA